MTGIDTLSTIFQIFTYTLAPNKVIRYKIIIIQVTCELTSHSIHLDKVASLNMVEDLCILIFCHFVMKT